MTGFTEKKFDSENFSVRISIKSLNHRFFDWSYHGNQIGEIENKLRVISQKRLHRGKVEVFIRFDYCDSEGWELRVNEAVLSEILSSLERASSKMLKNVSFSVGSLLNMYPVIELKRKDFTEEEVIFLEKSFEKTLDELMRMKIREGCELKKEIQKHVQIIERAVGHILKLSKKHPLLIQKKLKERLKILEYEGPLSGRKLEEEVAYLAQKYDLSEEIERLKSHLLSLQCLLGQKEEKPVGKKIDFFAQEIYREANTLNSKAQNIEIIKESLVIKGEVESIRQQSQNIE